MMTEETEYALKFNATLESLRSEQCPEVVKRIELSGFSLYDLQESEPLVVVNAQNDLDEWRCFWFIEANAVLQYVTESEDGAYFASPGDTLIIIDERSPERVIETVHLYMRYRPPAK